MKKIQEASIEEELLDIARGVKAQVEYQAELGLKGFPSSEPYHDESNVGAASSREMAPGSSRGKMPLPQNELRAEEILSEETFTLADIRKKMGECTLCDLNKSRTQIVFGVGAEDAELMFVGEAPGANEDRQGEPFVGRAGQLLTKIIKAMQFEREEVYIANVNKCRPPDNRDPKPDEVAACEPFLVQQIQAIKPKVIVALGRWAAQTLLKTSTGIGALRGNFHDYHGILLMPTYHPAAILRNPNHKKPVWDDMQQVMKKLGKEP